MTNVMIVDDEIQFGEALKRRLKARELDVTYVQNGVEAVLKLETGNDFDVILLDVMMPDMNGIETLLKIKASYPLVQVIMLTGHATLSTAIESVRQGAFDYLTKPCDIHDLMEKIEVAASKKQKLSKEINDILMKPFVSEKDKKRMIDNLLK